ncbi:MAG: hypothetical protein IJY25_02345, partial [Bacilli bacterium]|nr:hypothetical protein [Bacilli bacterium]
ENLEYELKDYQLKEKICDTSNVCKLGIKKEFYITIKYKDNINNSSITEYNLNLDFNFKAAYNVTYTDITVEDTYPSIILETDTLEVDLGENAPSSIKVLMSEAEITNYTYENGVLSIPNVSGNIEILKNSLAIYITNLYSPNSTVTNNSITYNIDTTNGIIDDGLGGTVPSGGNLRYYGASPNNYIDIGDRDSSGNIILWRIIGVFETKYATDSLPCNTDSNNDGHYDNCASEKLVKIIRDESIGKIAWDSNNGENWSIATLNTYLNTSTYYQSLSVDVISKIETSLWNLGGYSTDTKEYVNAGYEIERETNVYSGNPTEWVGKIGLMYPSDYGYATDLKKCNEILNNYGSSACMTNDWLYSSISNWTLSPLSSSSGAAFYISGSTGIVRNNSSKINNGVRPVLYLKSDTVKLSGTGVYNSTTQDPYVVELGDGSTSGGTAG